MSCNRPCERRKFLKTGIQSACALAFAPSLSAILSACNQAPLTTATGPSQVVPLSFNNIYTFNFTDHPQLQSPGGSIHVTINAASGAKEVFVTRVDAGTADTVSTICTHLQCELNPYDSTTGQYLCNCHGSIFAANGSVVQGPAVTSLASYPSTITGTAIEVTVL